MVDGEQSEAHSAEAAALGFYYQSFFALLTLLQQNTDDATVAVERPDTSSCRSTATSCFISSSTRSASPMPELKALLDVRNELISDKLDSHKQRLLRRAILEVVDRKTIREDGSARSSCGPEYAAMRLGWGDKQLR
jgi:hypothetical protein